MNDLVHALMEARRRNPLVRHSMYTGQRRHDPFQIATDDSMRTQNLDLAPLEYPLDSWGKTREDLAGRTEELNGNASEDIFENQQTDNIPPSGGLPDAQRRKLEEYENRLGNRKESARELQIEAIEGFVSDMEKNSDPLASRARICQARSPDNGAQFLECLFGLEDTRV